MDLPPTGQGRERTLTAVEWIHIQDALAETLPTTRAAVYTARFSAARRGEVVSLDWSDLKLEDPDKATALLRDTESRHKNRAGVAPRNRTIPLPLTSSASSWNCGPNGVANTQRGRCSSARPDTGSRRIPSRKRRPGPVGVQEWRAPGSMTCAIHESPSSAMH